MEFCFFFFFDPSLKVLFLAFIRLLSGATKAKYFDLATIYFPIGEIVCRHKFSTSEFIFFFFFQSTSITHPFHWHTSTYTIRVCFLKNKILAFFFLWHFSCNIDGLNSCCLFSKKDNRAINEIMVTFVCHKQVQRWWREIFFSSLNVLFEFPPWFIFASELKLIDCARSKKVQSWNYKRAMRKLRNLKVAWRKLPDKCDVISTHFPMIFY